jgi:hypothetical protein
LLLLYAYRYAELIGLPLLPLSDGTLTTIKSNDSSDKKFIACELARSLFVDSSKRTNRSSSSTAVVVSSRRGSSRAGGDAPKVTPAAVTPAAAQIVEDSKLLTDKLAAVLANPKLHEVSNRLCIHCRLCVRVPSTLIANASASWV